MHTLPDYPTFADLAAKAATGDGEAMFNMGETFRLGWYAKEIDEVAARGWYESAATAGHFDALFIVNHWEQRAHLNFGPTPADRNISKQYIDGVVTRRPRPIRRQEKKRSED